MKCRWEGPAFPDAIAGCRTPSWGAGKRWAPGTSARVTISASDRQWFQAIPLFSNPTSQKWFDTSVFKVLPAYKPRTNPWQYPDLKGPISGIFRRMSRKASAFTEKIRADFRMAAYNLTNRLNRADPDLVVTSSTFGQALRQSANTVGRQMEYGLKIVF